MNCLFNPLFSHPVTAFNNMHQDRTKIHERMAYAFYRVAGVTAPKANHARVSFNAAGRGTYYRTMLNLQTVSDSRFLEERFMSPGTLWDQLESAGSLNCCPAKEPRHPVNMFECDEGCGDDSAALLRTLTDVGGTCRTTSGYGIDLPALWERLDQVEFIKLMAVDKIIRHWDGPCGSNYNGYGNNMHICDIKAAFDGVDFDATTKISYTEFTAACLEETVIRSKGAMIQAFRTLDTDGDGKITRKELRATLPADVTDATIDQIMKDADFDGDGAIDKAEFELAMRGGIVAPITTEEDFTQKSTTARAVATTTTKPGLKPAASIMKAHSPKMEI